MTNTKTCHACGYQWTPRTETPKECPRCKARQDNKKNTQNNDKKDGKNE